MKLSAILLLISTVANGLYIVDSRDDVSVAYDTESLEARAEQNTYQVGVRGFKDAGCKGLTSGTCNHDENSCNGGCYGPKWHVKSIGVKVDGSANGNGCMTVFPKGHNCSGESYKVFTLHPNDCKDVSKDALGFEIGCVVVASKNRFGNVCERTPDNC